MAPPDPDRQQLLARPEVDQSPMAEDCDRKRREGGARRGRKAPEKRIRRGWSDGSSGRLVKPQAEEPVAASTHTTFSELDDSGGELDSVDVRRMSSNDLGEEGKQRRLSTRTFDGSSAHAAAQQPAALLWREKRKIRRTLRSAQIDQSARCSTPPALETSLFATGVTTTRSAWRVG